MISIKLLICTPDEFSDTKVRRVGTASNGAALGCEESSRQPSTICTKLGIPSAFPLPHLPAVPYTLREKRYRKNHPRVRSPKASNQREKISSAMAYKLKDRKEKMLYKGSVYELTLQWDRESLRKCFCGMPPFYAHIRKDGANYAQIDCYSNGDDFSVVPMHPLFEEPEWIVHFLKSDINSIPLQKLLELLPI